MIIVETSVFTRHVQEILSDGEYLALQSFLAVHPTAGVVIPGSGGLRKLRWKYSGHGKRGGSRIIYYYHRPGPELLMLFIFRKNEAADLTPAQLRQLRAVVEESYHET